MGHAEEAGQWREIIDAADDLLRQCEDLVRTLPDGAYARSSEVLSGGTAGKHLRHLVDHYRAILQPREGVIEYDHRERNVPMETSRDAALDVLRSVRGGLGGLCSRTPAEGVRVRVMVRGEGFSAVLSSTLARELAFATHHAVHHQAMLKAIAGEMGVAAPADFGKAPSTICHEVRTLTGSQAGAHAGNAGGASRPGAR